ncbi:MAG: carbon-nitrogen hydrolase family protein [Mobilicoccus sp.]|nr:carbon-nitrogen hydrolase family protein [Mobilicoccus sp.]
MTATLTVAACQMSAGDDVAENLSAIRDGIRDAAQAGAGLVVFPEAAMSRFGSDLAAAAQPLDGPFATAIRETAEEHDVVAVVGMFEPADAGRVYNTLLATGPGVDERYRKIHLFDAFGSKESDHVAPGEELVTIDVDGVCVGLATCYDVRFADQFTALGQRGAQLVVLPASWGDGPGKGDQWDLLARARAHDAQAWLLACDQAWSPPEGSQPLGVGRSQLVDPLGVVHAALDHRPGLLVGRIDVGHVADVRQRVPVLSSLAGR